MLCVIYPERQHGLGVTAHNICKLIFSNALSLSEARFAMAETPAHLVCPVQQGGIQVMRRNRVYIYRN